MDDKDLEAWTEFGKVALQELLREAYSQDHSITPWHVIPEAGAISDAMMAEREKRRKG